MANKAKSLLDEAVADVASLQKAAEENAKNYLIEALTPTIKQLAGMQVRKENFSAPAGPAVAMQMGQNGSETMQGLEPGMYEIGDNSDELDAEVPELNLDADVDPDAEGDEDLEGDETFEGDADDIDGEDAPDFDDENQDDVDGDEDDVEVDFDADDDDSDHEHNDEDVDDDSEDDVQGEGVYNSMKNKDYKKMDADEMDESVEITSEDLKKAFASVLKQAKNEAASLGEPGDPEKGDVGLGGKVEKDKQWAEVVPQKTKMHAKEHKVVQSLRKELKQYKEAYSYLKKNLQEMNLFNAKLIYTTKLLQNNLSQKQKMGVVESIDNAKNQREVKAVYKALSEHYKIAGVVSENKKSNGIKGRASAYTRSSSTLSENVQHGSNSADQAFLDRLGVLAGVK